MGKLRRVGAALTYANIMSTLAFMLALGGTAWAAATITSADIVNETVRGVDIKNGEVRNAELANSAVTSAKIANRTILARDIAPGNVRTEEIRNGTIRNHDIAANSITVGRHAPYPFASIYTDGLAIADATNTDVAFISEDADTFGGHAPGGDKLTVKQAGLWSINALTLWDTNNTGTRWTRLTVNDFDKGTVGGATSLFQAHALTRTLRLNAGDEIRVQVRQSSGGPLQADVRLDAVMLSP